MFPVSLSEYDLVNTTGSCSRGNGWGYRGQVDTTEFGLPCQAWTSQTPHRHPRLPPHEVLGAGFACRNPWGLSHRPWCYTADPTRRWQYCHVPSCGEFYSDVIQSVLLSNLTVLHHTCTLGSVGLCCLGNRLNPSPKKWPCTLHGARSQGFIGRGKP